ncbi:hypothetical protein [Sphingomonas palmae]|nr:hypothetical protein [Sphingomonas palmae]
MKSRTVGRMAVACLTALAVSGAIPLPAAGRQKQPPQASDAKPSCSMPAGWAAIAQRAPRYVIFGESHGTEEAPTFFGNVACALAARGKRILVAVEYDSSDDPAFQAAWLLPPQQFGPALLAAGWKGRDDGVASEAMFRLLTRLHALKSHGKKISIVAFNGAKDAAQRERFKSLPGQGGHEAAQAENIRNAAAASRYDYVLVLTGNLHARKNEFGNGARAFKPMALALAPADQIVSLDMKSASGTAWNCQLKAGVKFDDGKPLPSDATECGIHPYTSKVDLRRPPFMSLYPVEGIDRDDAYDGIYWIGAGHGSKPALP